MTAVGELGCRALAPAHPAPWVCRWWGWLGGALVRSAAGHRVCWIWGHLGGAPVQATVSSCLCLAGATCWGLQRGLWLRAACAGLGGSWESLGFQARLAATNEGWGPLSRRHGHAEACHCLLGCGPLREFGKVHSVSPGRLPCGRAAGGGLGPELQEGGTGSPGVTGVGRQH